MSSSRMAETASVAVRGLEVEEMVRMRDAMEMAEFAGRDGRGLVKMRAWIVYDPDYE